MAAESSKGKSTGGAAAVSASGSGDAGGVSAAEAGEAVAEAPATQEYVVWHGAGGKGLPPNSFEVRVLNAADFRRLAGVESGAKQVTWDAANGHRVLRSDMDWLSDDQLDTFIANESGFERVEA